MRKEFSTYAEAREFFLDIPVPLKRDLTNGWVTMISYEGKKRELERLTGREYASTFVVETDLNGTKWACLDYGTPKQIN